MIGTYEVGKIYPGYEPRPEGTLFDLRDDGAILFVFFNNPTEEEVKQFDSNLEIRFTELYNEIVLTIKVGNLNWMDAFYNPHLSRDLTELPNFQIGQGLGLGLTLMLLDATDGKIKAMRILGLSENFTDKFLQSVDEIKGKDFNEETHQQSMNTIYQRYPTRELVRMCRNYCKFN